MASFQRVHALKIRESHGSSAPILRTNRLHVCGQQRDVAAMKGRGSLTAVLTSRRMPMPSSAPYRQLHPRSYGGNLICENVPFIKLQ